MRASVASTVCKFGEVRLGIVFSSQHQALLRLVISERERFPDLARTYYERGPRLGRDSLVTYLEAMNNMNKLDIDNVEEAARVFIGMLLHEWYIEYLLFRTEPPTSREIANRVEHVVDRFLGLYRPIGPVNS